MRKRGFTLIELLAVIVILAIITLIVIPVITNIIEETREKAFLNSVDGYISSIKAEQIVGQLFNNSNVVDFNIIVGKVNGIQIVQIEKVILL